MKQKPSAAAILRRIVASAHRAEPEIEPAVKPFARRLEERGIAEVPGLDDEQSQWYDRAIEFNRRSTEAVEQHREKEKAEEPAPTPTEQLWAEMAKQANESIPHIPLNGQAVLRAALGGRPGTINGEAGR